MATNANLDAEEVSPLIPVSLDFLSKFFVISFNMQSYNLFTNLPPTFNM